MIKHLFCELHVVNNINHIQSEHSTSQFEETRTDVGTDWQTHIRVHSICAHKASAKATSYHMHAIMRLYVTCLFLEILRSRLRRQFTAPSVTCGTNKIRDLYNIDSSPTTVTTDRLKLIYGQNLGQISLAGQFPGIGRRNGEESKWRVWLGYWKAKQASFSTLGDNVMY
jgi:hypothetical protein